VIALDQTQRKEVARAGIASIAAAALLLGFSGFRAARGEREYARSQDERRQSESHGYLVKVLKRAGGLLTYEARPRPVSPSEESEGRSEENDYAASGARGQRAAGCEVS
jgi:hypothetical protein